MSKFTTRYASYEETEREEIVRLYVDNLWDIAKVKPDLMTVIKAIYHEIKDNRVIVVETDGKIVGCASWIISHYWFSPEEILFDTGFFIAKEYRKTRAAHVLLNAFKAEAVKQNKRLIMGAGTTDQSVLSTMEKRYPKMGTGFLVVSHV